MNTLSSALTWTAVVVIVLVALPVMALIWLADWTPAKRLTGRTFRIIGSAVTYINPSWRIRVGGVDPATLRHPYVVVSNHQSQADIPLVSRLPWEMKWVGKKELFDLPVMGWLMHMAGDIPVDRADARSRATVLARARRKLEAGVSVMFFAEGTRSRDGRLKHFHDGAFRLAIDAGVPVLPVALDGTMDALPKHGWRFNRADVRLDVLPPVPTDGLTMDDLPALRERVRGLILERVAGWREVPPASADALAELPPAAPAVPEPAASGAGGGEDRAKSAAVASRPSRPG